MKTTRNSLLMSAMSLVLSVAILMGATFAWFTDSVTNSGNTIQSGTLEIQAFVQDVDSSKSTYTIEGVNGGNSFGFEDEPADIETLTTGIISETNWEPGQSNAKLLTVENKGSVSAKVKVDFTITEGGLTEALWYDFILVDDSGTMVGSFGRREMSTIETYPETVEIPVGAGSSVSSILVYGMKEDAGNEFQGLKFEGYVNILATQGSDEADGFGSKDYDKAAEYPTVPVAGTTEALIQALNAAQPGDTLQLSAATYKLEEAITIPSGVTLLGANAGTPANEWYTDSAAAATKIVAPESGDRVLKIEQTSADAPVSDVVLDGILVDCDSKNVKGIYVKKSAGEAMTGIVIRNCAVVNCGNDGIDVSNTNGAVIQNNYVSGVYDNGIRYGNYKNTDGAVGYVTGNVVENITGTINGGIAITEGAGDVVVSGNTLRRIGSAGQAGTTAVDMGESAIVVEKVYEGGIITIKDNTITDSAQGIAVYKFSAPTENDKVIIQNNEVSNATTFGIATSTLNDKEFTEHKTVVEIKDNTISGACVKGSVYVETTNRYDETTDNWEVIQENNTTTP